MFVGGGRSVGEDVKVIRKGVHIVVGTTGRVCQLVNEDILPTTHVRLFVLDEADKLMEEDFQKDIKLVFRLFGIIGEMRSSHITALISASSATFIR